MIRHLVALVSVMTLLSACGNSGKVAAESADPMADAPVFNPDSAYKYVEQQLAFGPRVPGTPAHDSCAGWLAAELRRHGADSVIEQRATVTAYNGDRLPVTNIMARFNDGASERVLILAHYDTRPWADSDSHRENHDKPIPGANDGGSGVAVILELARIMNQINPGVGVDLLLVDAEDYGRSEGWDRNSDTWCLGTQHWVTDMPYEPGKLPVWGACLDMVGGMGAVFHREFGSNVNARPVVDRIWDVAARSGYGDVFINEVGGAITDDHLYVNRAGIPCIDIIESNNTETHSFPSTWHTMDDDLAHIDRRSLKAVGQTVANTLYLTRK